ncbi:MAG TPA: transposase [Pyrinomonadaceae bacterium]|nr:transposase [Pyrinomonadaceae bacterium]
MWNDTDIPLAVFFTFRCYGTWLHGDERGSVDRNNNKYGSPRITANRNWQKHGEELLLHAPVTLNAERRKSVEKAIRDLCAKRDWTLVVINVRTNHIHVVICIGTQKPKDVLTALKANATRQLREERLWLHEHSPWADKGSKRNLWNEKSVWEACNYVVTSKVTNCLTSTGGKKNPVAIAPGSDRPAVRSTN